MSDIRDDEIPSLSVGDVIYECEGGLNVEARVVTKPVEIEGAGGRRAWRWSAVNTQNGEDIDYLLTEGLSHYGPRLYREPQYVWIVNGEARFLLVGTPPVSQG